MSLHSPSHILFSSNIPSPRVAFWLGLVMSGLVDWGPFSSHLDCYWCDFAPILAGPLALLREVSSPLKHQTPASQFTVVNWQYGQPDKTKNAKTARLLGRLRQPVPRMTARNQPFLDKLVDLGPQISIQDERVNLVESDWILLRILDNHYHQINNLPNSSVDQISIVRRLEVSTPIMSLWQLADLDRPIV